MTPRPASGTPLEVERPELAGPPSDNLVDGRNETQSARSGRVPHRGRLGLTEEESRLVDLRVALIRAVRRLRSARDMTQQQPEAKLKSS